VTDYGTASTAHLLHSIDVYAASQSEDTLEWDSNVFLSSNGWDLNDDDNDDMFTIYSKNLSPEIVESSAQQIFDTLTYYETINFTTIRRPLGVENEKR
jgi:hypothetical protein